jgi:type I restriction enzyme, S subunit
MVVDMAFAKCLGDYVRLQRGNTYQSALLGKSGPTLLGLASIARNGGFRGDNLKTYGGHSDPRILLSPGDIYVSLKDVTQSADLLGAVARVPNSIRSGRLTQDTVKLVHRFLEINQL